MMKRDEYETLAAAVAESMELNESEIERKTRRRMAFDLADALTGTGARFDPVRWLKDCEVGPIDPQEVARWTKRLALRVASVSERKEAARRTGVPLGRY